MMSQARSRYQDLLGSWNLDESTGNWTGIKNHYRIICFRFNFAEVSSWKSYLYGIWTKIDVSLRGFLEAPQCADTFQNHTWVGLRIRSFRGAKHACEISMNDHACCELFKKKKKKRFSSIGNRYSPSQLVLHLCMRGCLTPSSYILFYMGHSWYSRGTSKSRSQ